MVWFLYGVSIVWIAFGSTVILYTERVRDLAENMEDSLSPRILGGSLLAFGILLAISSFWSGVVWFLFLMALMIGGVGVIFILSGEEKAKGIVRTWIGISDTGLRLWGLIFVITGMAILAWI